MHLSVTSWSFPACSLPEAWALARAIGIPQIDLGPLHGPALDTGLIRQDPGAAAAALAPLGLRSPNLYWLFGATPHDHPLSDPESLPRNLNDLEQAASFAAALNIPTLFLLPGVSRPRTPRADLHKATATALRAMIPLAKAHGLTLSVEPHVGGILTTPAETLALIEAVPGLKLTLDYAHFTCMGIPQSAIDPLARHAAHVHLRQARPGALQAKWGAGTLDFAAMFETLRAAEYQGSLAIEYVHQSYMDTLHDDVLTETIAMRNLAHQHGII